MRRVRVRDGVVSRDVKGEEVVLDLGSGELFSLDEVGSRVWSGLREGQEPEEIVAGIVGEWEVDRDVAREDVERFVDALLACGLLEERAPEQEPPAPVRAPGT